MSLTSYLPRSGYINLCFIFPKPKKKKKMMSVSYFWEDLCSGNFAISLKLM